MIVSRKRGFIFLRTPKTASTSLTFQIRDSIESEIDFHSGLGPPQVDVEFYHLNLKEAINRKILSENEIKEFRIYATIRNPIDRFISIANSLHPNPIFKFMSNDQKVRETFDKINSGFAGFIFKPQVEWLYHNGSVISHPIIYPNFNQFLRDEIGCGELRYSEHSSKRGDKQVNLSEELQSEILRMFPEDQALWERLTTKEGSGEG
jgi:hypothetical protein